MMHLAHPSLSMTGKKSGAKKWRNAEEKRKYEEQEASWQKLLKDTAAMCKATSKPKVKPMSTPQPYRRDTGTKNIPSVDTNYTGAVSSKPNQQYTGTLVKGISTLHKSNAVPIFSNEDAIEHAKMRRG